MSSPAFSDQDLRAAIARGVGGKVDIQIRHEPRGSQPDLVQVILVTPDESFTVDAAADAGHFILTADEFADYVFTRAPREMVSGGR